ncbi:MAG: M20/M25/M40 family metallo-hydrolase [Gemmatimonadaceae bacterium]|nr:M20/M25/M40 family metallo-hydrolase [Gemmatimonadaceae bacterium]
MYKLRLHVSVLLLGIVLPFTAGAQLRLSRPEQRMVDYVRLHEEEAISFLEKVVNINSGTMNFEGVRAVGAEFDRELKALGFQTRWETMPAEMNRAGNFFAERKGRRWKNGKRILLLGHLDTVFEGEGQKFSRADTIAKGAGTSDMKGGDVAILYALKAMNAAGVLDEAHIIVAFTGDEESSGSPDSIARRGLIDAARRSDVALAFESDEGKGTVARRGFSSWTLRVTGRQAHSSGVFTQGSGYGAIYEIARILDEFRTALSTEQYLTFNPGILIGGTTVNFDSTKLTGSAAGKLNIISPVAVATGDLRFLTDEQLQRTRATMRAIAARNLARTSAELTFDDGNPAMPPTPGNYSVLAIEDSVSQALGRGPIVALDPGQRGAGDISYISNYVDALDGIGVTGPGQHTPNEEIYLPSLRRASERAAVMIYRISRQRKK